MQSNPEHQARFVELVQAHQGVIRKIAALYARDFADRQDLFQEITLQLWRSFEAYRGEAAFSTFLYRVALNTALMRVRRSARRPDADAGDAVEELASPVASRSDEDVERLYAAIRQLGPLDRAIVLLVLEEQSYGEIATVTGLSTSNVSVRLVRSKERLRKFLGTRESTQGSKSCSKTT